jgi:hypothetical protein
VAVPADPEELSTCFARRVASWFENEGRERVLDRVYLRQMNMAVALAASRWNEFAEGPDAVQRMHNWLAEVERRAVARGARARAEAFALARSWFEECGGRSEG